MVTAVALHTMKKMGSDPKKRAALVKDTTCIGGIVVMLSNSDTTIVTLALETLLVLVNDGENAVTLRDSLGMLEQLEALLNRSGGQFLIKSLAEKLYLLLTEMGDKVPLKDASNLEPRWKSSCSKKVNRSLRSSHKHKSIILQLRGLTNQSDQDLCMRLLLKVKGVISVTFDTKKKRIILRVKMDVKPESLIHAVERSQTMSAQQVVRDDNGDELLLSFHLRDDTEKENAELPSYLSDDCDSPIVDKKAIARMPRAEKKDGGWFSSAANFISNSFYW